MISSKPSMFSTSLPPCPLPKDEEFNLFHSIDRRLYKRLIIVLGRDIEESMKVMAFWLWLEQQGIGSRNLVKRMLSFPTNLVNDIADESVVCLKCVDKNHFSNPETAGKLALIPDMLGKNITLKIFYEHRTMVLSGVTKMLNEVCDRAFKDINQIALMTITRRVPGQVENIDWRASSSGVVETDAVLYSLSANTRPFGEVDQSGSSMVGNVLPVLRFTDQELQREEMQLSGAVNDELSENCNGKLNLQEEENHVFPDDRTIILTFSMRNPISEDEFRDFFTRSFGDFIEEIHMEVQPFSPGEPVLYAQVVARVASMADAVVKGGVAEYCINGKYVHAQKYVTKNTLVQ